MSEAYEESEFREEEIKFALLAAEIKQMLAPLRENLRILQIKMEERRRRDFDGQSRSAAQTSTSQDNATEMERLSDEIQRLSDEIREGLAEARRKHNELMVLQRQIGGDRKDRSSPLSPLLQQPLFAHEQSHHDTRGQTSEIPSSPTQQAPTDFDPFGADGRGEQPTMDDSNSSVVDIYARYIRMAGSLQQNMREIKKTKRSLRFGKASYLNGGVNMLLLGFLCNFVLPLYGAYFGGKRGYQIMRFRRGRAEQKLNELIINTAQILENLGEIDEKVRGIESVTPANSYQRTAIDMLRKDVEKARRSLVREGIIQSNRGRDEYSL